jgi:dTDP-4-dehydrorhamnose reductase
MNVLILGAKGQVGHALCATTPDNAQIIALDRAALDLTDIAAIEAAMIAHNPDLVINAAAYTAVDKAESEADAAFAANRDGPAVLARACGATGARLVHISTDFVFDGTQSHPYREDDPVAPTSVYGRSKAEGEAAVRATNPDALIVRTAWVYAATGKNFALTMLRLMAERGTVSVVADQVGTPTHAKSLARAIWGLAATDATGIVHVTDAGVASWYDFAVAIAECGVAAGLLDTMPAITPIATSDYPTPAKRPACSVLDNRKGWALLGRPARHWRAELNDMIAERTSL